MGGEGQQQEPEEPEAEDNNVPNRSLVQKRRSIYNWNPGPLNVEKKMLLRNKSQASGTSLQEAIEYVDHDILTNRFHVTHYGGCAILFNKDTFHPNIEVKSLCLHDTRRDLPVQVMEGDRWWVLQGCFHVPHSFRHLLSAARKLVQFWWQVISMVLRGDVAAETTSVLLEGFTDCALPTPPGPSTIVGTWIHSGQLGRRLRISQTTWFSTLLESEQTWCVLHSTKNTRLETD